MIWHLGKYYPPAPGGIETHVRTLAQAQAALGEEVGVVCVRHDGGATNREEWDGAVRVVRLGRWTQIAKLDVCPRVVSTLRRLTAAARILHLQTPNPLMVLALRMVQPRCPWVITHQSDVLVQKLRARLLEPFDTWVYDRALRVLATSPPYVNGSPKLRRARSAGRLGILPNGIDLEPLIHPSAADLDHAHALRQRWADRGPIWLGCGRFIYYKGFLNAVRALAQTPGTLILVGDGPDRPAIEAEARRLGVRDRLVLPGAMDYRAITPYYLACDAFWFPSIARTEAFGIAQVEALAAGKPVINTAIPDSGVAWVSPHEQTGLTVPPHDPAALAAAARRLLEEPGLAQRLGQAARQRALSEFDHRVMARRALEFYHPPAPSQAPTGPAPQPPLPTPRHDPPDATPPGNASAS